jgi:hypothetical protein
VDDEGRSLEKVCDILGRFFASSIRGNFKQVEAVPKTCGERKTILDIRYGSHKSAGGGKGFGLPYL